MPETPVSVKALVRHYKRVARERMQGLPIVNPELAVEAVGFGYLDEHQLGVLITPWFMNLVLLPGSDEWAGHSQGSTVSLVLPNARQEFLVGHDDALGVFLSAILFRSVSDFPDQATAVAVAEEVLRMLWSSPETRPATAPLSRRDVLTGLGSSDA